MGERSRSIRLIIVATFLLFLSGCNNLSTEKYDQLRIGMQYDAVVSILGRADECEGAMGVKSCTWGDEQKYIQIGFAGDKVVFFSGHGL